MEHSLSVSGEPRCVLGFWHGSAGSLSAFWISQMTLFLIPSFWVQSSLALHGSHAGSQSPPQDLGPVDMEGIEDRAPPPKTDSLQSYSCISSLWDLFSFLFEKDKLPGGSLSKEGCDLSGTFPRELNEQAWAVSLSLPAPSPCMQLHLEA